MVLTKFYTPTCVIRNISNKAVRVIGLTTVQPGETIDLYNEIDPRVDLFEDPILKGLEKPHGTLYQEVVINKNLEIVSLDLPQFNYSIIHPFNVAAVNVPTPGQVPSYYNEDQFQWINAAITGVLPPLEVGVGGIISIPPADASTDGYLSKEDWARFNAAAKGAQKIWQYQDFVGPVSTSSTLTAFENGTGLTFDNTYIQDGTAEIVLVSDNTAPPTTTLAFPGSIFPGNRVSVSSHIGTTVILNQAPDTSLTCRIYFLVRVPANIPLPSDYQEAPDFLRGADYSNLDDYYVNQNETESIYGVKTFEDDVIINGNFAYTPGAADGYFLKSDGYGNATWAVVAGSGGNHSSLSGLGNDDHSQYALLAGSDSRNPVTGEIDFSSGELRLPVSNDPLSSYPSAQEGNIAYDNNDGYVVFYDGYQWVQVGTGASGAGDVTGAINVGTDGYGFFKQKTSSILEFKNLVAGSNKVSITGDGYNIYVDFILDPNEAVAQLGLDGYFHLASNETVTGHTTFNPASSTEPAFTIVQDTIAPTTNVSGGSVSIIGGIQYIYDNTRTKWLSSERKFLTSGRNSNNVTNSYLEVSESVTSSDAGFRILRNGTITGIWAQTRDVETWTFEIRKNGAVTVISSLSVIGSRGATDATINVDISQDDEIQFYVNGTGIAKPVVGIEIAWRV